MLGYYFTVALRSLGQSKVLTALMVVAVAVGIGASMTTLSIFRAMSGDPIPEKSGKLFVVQLDNFGPAPPTAVGTSLPGDHLPRDMTYTDAVALVRAHAASHQVASYFSSAAVEAPDQGPLPIWAPVRPTTADFFGMFDVPFQYGAPWNAADDEARRPVVVIARQLNDRLFGGANSVGRIVTLNNQAYRIVGVVQDWTPTPRFYALGLEGAYGFLTTEQVFLPFATGLARGLSNQGGAQCPKDPGTGMEALMRSECVWIDVWVELPTAAAVRDYRSFLSNYAAEQRQKGRFNWTPKVSLRNVRQWLAYNHVVTNDVSVLVLVSFAFLLVCLLNGVVLMLARSMSRSSQVSIRRALGAGRRAIFMQGFMEAGIVGLAGGVLGLGMALLGLLLAKALFIPPIGTAPPPPGLTQLDTGDVVIAVALSIGATLLAGLYPTWRASRVQPAWQLKSQ
jgi:putative ABC transport system permease protein